MSWRKNIWETLSHYRTYEKINAQEISRKAANNEHLKIKDIYRNLYNGQDLSITEM